jgi:PAS domain S-box-containing protein
VNAKTAAMFGYAREELIGQPVEILVPERWRDIHTRHRLGYALDPRVRPMGRGLDLVGLRKDGTEFPVEISLSFIVTEDGTQTIGFVTDITERLALERATRQDERLTAVGRLAAGIAHEMNDPLGIISSRLELMLMEAAEAGLPPAVIEDLKVLHRNAIRVTSIANSLLAFSRQPTNEPTVVNLNDVVTETLPLLGQEIAQPELSIICSLEAALPPILGHARALEQVVFNLLTNAVQAMGGVGEIRVATAFTGGRIHLDVDDTGPGIPPGALPRIFEPFYTTKSVGTGLGLWVSYGIVQDHHGTIDVRSVPGRGTRFRLSFPPAPDHAKT